MSDRNNDKIKSLIKGRLGNYSHPVSDDLWPLIERQLQMRMRRNRVKRMISMVAGVAAVILVAILLLMIPEKKDVITPLSSPIANYNAGVEIAQKRKPLIFHAEESVNHGEMRGKKHGEKKIESIRTPQQDSAISSKEQQPTTTREVSKSENRAKKTESENARGLNQATPTNSWSDDIPIRRKRKNLSLTLAFNEIGKNSQSTDKYRIHGGDIGSSYKIVNRNSRFNLL